jgi:hypothetical protein
MCARSDAALVNDAKTTVLSVVAARTRATRSTSILTSRARPCEVSILTSRGNRRGSRLVTVVWATCARGAASRGIRHHRYIVVCGTWSGTIRPAVMSSSLAVRAPRAHRDSSTDLGLEHLAASHHRTHERRRRARQGTLRPGQGERREGKGRRRQTGGARRQPGTCALRAALKAAEEARSEAPRVCSAVICIVGWSSRGRERELNSHQGTCVRRQARRVRRAATHVVGGAASARGRAPPARQVPRGRLYPRARRRQDRTMT